MQHNFNSVFVVDDDRFHLEIMKQLLSDAGIEKITCFESGVDCLNEIHQNRLISTYGLQGVIAGLIGSQILLMSYWTIILQLKNINLWRSSTSY